MRGTMRWERRWRQSGSKWSGSNSSCSLELFACFSFLIALPPSSLFLGQLSASDFHSNPRNRNATMRRHPNKVKIRAVKSIAQNFSNATQPLIKLMTIPFRPSQTGEEHPPGPLETAEELSYGSSVANPITSETADDVSLANELSLETVTPAEEFSGVTEARIKAVVDEGLIDQPTPRRTNPTTVIHPKINMEYAIEYKETVLYEKQRGQWVAEPLLNKTAERVAPTVPNFPNNGVLDFKRIVPA